MGDRESLNPEFALYISKKNCLLGLKLSCFYYLRSSLGRFPLDVFGQTCKLWVPWVLQNPYLFKIFRQIWNFACVNHKNYVNIL